MTREDVLKLNDKAQDLMDDLEYNYTDMSSKQQEAARQTIADYARQEAEWRSDKNTDVWDALTTDCILPDAQTIGKPSFAPEKLEQMDLPEEIRNKLDQFMEMAKT